MKYGDEKFLPIGSLAQVYDIQIETVTSHIIENSIPRYVRVKFATRKIELKYDTDKFGVRVISPREVEFENIIIDEFYSLDDDEFLDICHNNSINLGKYEISRLRTEINWEKLPCKIEDEPYFIATNNSPYTSDLVWVLEDAINFEEFSNTPSMSKDTNSIDITTFPELLQIAIRMYQVCWPLREEGENRPIKVDFVAYLRDDLHFYEKTAKDIWNIIHPKDDSRKRSGDKDFDFSKLDAFKQPKT